MANKKQLALLKEGSDAWGIWREANYRIIPNLSRANLKGARLNGADLTEADLHGADLTEADLSNATLTRATLTQANLKGARLNGADLTKADLTSADLTEADLSEANLTKAGMNGSNLSSADLTGAEMPKVSLFNVDLSEANLTGANLGAAMLAWSNLAGANLNSASLRDAIMTAANLSSADLTNADLTGADLSGAKLNGARLIGTNLEGVTLVNTNFENATLEGCYIYGIAAWDVNLKGTSQKNLNISADNQAVITVDDLEVAQFIYLLLNNTKLRNVIDTITGKAALILGRFTEERKVVLEAIRDALRQQGYLPILFDFEKPASRDLTETIRTLASLSRFIIADLTDARSIPQELMAIVPFMPSLAVQSIILSEQKPWAMYEGLERYPWVLPLHEYESQESLIQELGEKVIQPAEQKANEQRPKPLG
jgi:uncharacterized protein YjbI with pentapeptide repeats